MAILPCFLCNSMLVSSKVPEAIALASHKLLYRASKGPGARGHLLLRSKATTARKTARRPMAGHTEDGHSAIEMLANMSGGFGAR